jgi:SAM-dependent methyltransferase/uncharacterized protein YbaR (Trm112 family)
MSDLWSLLRCPACGDALARQDEGLLRSGCGLWFPVVDGIPRIFVGELRRIYATDFGDFLSRRGLTVGSNGAPTTAETEAKLATRDSFGYEWTYFHEMLPEWEENARYYFEPIGGASTLKGKLCLEAGCGKGRHSYYALRAGARVVAVDFSRAVDVAAQNCKKVDGDRLFVQADIMNLPFQPGVFDAGYSFGVLHHLPDPEGGFRCVVDRVKPGGRVLVYLYHALEGEPVKQAILKGVNVARKLTTRLPHKMLLPISKVLGVGLYVGVVTPYKILRRLPPTRALAEQMPLKIYADYPMRVIINDQFDRFSAPIENRYRRDEVLGWLERAGLSDPVILGEGGWRAAGQKPSTDRRESTASSSSAAPPRPPR